MPEESQTLPSEREAELPMDVGDVLNIAASGVENIDTNLKPTALSMPVVSVDDDVQLASRLLNFSILYKEIMVPLEVPDSETVGKIFL